MSEASSHPQSLAEQKAALRASADAAIRALTPAAIVEASRRIGEHLLASDVYAQARTVLAYAPMAREADVTPIILDVLGGGKTPQRTAEAAKTPRRRLCLPRVDWAAPSIIPALVSDWSKDVVAGVRGIRVPAAHCPAVGAEEVDLVLVPGVAFDRAGGRLGRGGGFYDRLLAGIAGAGQTPGRPRAAIVGVALGVQVTSRVPMDVHDQRVGWLVTEEGLRATT